MRPRVPLPIGVNRSMSRVVYSSGSCSSRSCSFGIERRQVVEEDLVARLLRLLVVDRLDLEQGEVALAFLRRADLAGDDVAGAQVEAADLARRDVDVVRAGQVVVVGGAQKAEAVGQDLEHAFAVDEAVLLGLRAEDGEDQLLLAHVGGALDVEVLGDLRQLADLLFLERLEVEGALFGRRLFDRFGRRRLGARRRRCGCRTSPCSPRRRRSMRAAPPAAACLVLPTASSAIRVIPSLGWLESEFVATWRTGWPEVANVRQIQCVTARTLVKRVFVVKLHPRVVASALRARTS